MRETGDTPGKAKMKRENRLSLVPIVSDEPSGAPAGESYAERVARLRSAVSRGTYAPASGDVALALCRSIAPGPHAARPSAPTAA